MGCTSHRRKGAEVRPEQKWDYISLNDFKSTSCFTPLAYGYLWFSLIISTAVYAVDTFTAVNLLAFNKFSSSVAITQIIDINISRWIFSICIILSFINLGYEHIRARRIMNRGSVAECYLDTLAARLESARMGRGRGWKRFLVFAELTKSKKGAEYVALFTYFNLQSWIRVLICSGPRQVINALSMYSLYNSKLEINNLNFEASLMSFFQKIRALAQENYQEAVVLSGMLFTLVVWVFSFLALVLSGLFFIFFLWHYIPRTDGGLSGYCERKANKRLMHIVSIKINKAMADDERRRKKAELREAKKKGFDRPISMQATLPNVGDDKLPTMPMMSRTTTMTTSVDPSRPSTPGDYEMNPMGRPLPPSRSTTMASSTSQFSARAPLMSTAADMGRSASPVPSLPPIDINNYPPMRTGTAASMRSAGGPPLQRMPTNTSYAASTVAGTDFSFDSDILPPLPTAPRYMPNRGPDGYRGPGASIDRSATASPYSAYPGGGAGGRASPAPSSTVLPFSAYPGRSASPAPTTNTYRAGPFSPTASAAPAPLGLPPRSATNPPMATNAPYPLGPPTRNMTAPLPRHQPTDSSGSQQSMRGPAYGQRPQEGGYDYPPRSMTSQSQRPNANVNGGYEPFRPGTSQTMRQPPSGGIGYPPRPGTAQSQRQPPNSDYGNGWNRDVEKDPGYGY